MTTLDTATDSQAHHRKGVAAELLRHRKLLFLMARQDLKNKYGQFRFGLLWTIVEPLLMALLMYGVLTLLLRSTRGITVDPFIIYLVTGIIPFGWLSSSINQGPRTFRKYRTFLTFSKLPIVFWPMRSVHVGFLEVLLSIPVVVILTVPFGVFFSWGVILVPIGFVAQWFLCLGLAMIFSALGATFPDTQKMTGLLVRTFFWTSPILWQARDFGPIQKFLYLNPFHGILDMYRAAIWPDEVLNKPINYAISATVIVVVFVTGVLMMKARVKSIRRLG